MTQSRYRQLLDKRDRVGLSHQEANELGRVLAAMHGKPYSNAESLQAAARETRRRALRRLIRGRKRRREREAALTATVSFDMGA